MKRNQFARILALGLTIAVSTTVAFAAEEKEEAISLDKVPAAVRKSLATYAKDSEVKRVELGDQDGTKVYEFDIEQGSTKFELTLSKKGKFMGKEQEIQLSDMPSAAQTALKAKAGAAKLSSFEKAEDQKHKITYEGVIEKDGKKTEVAVDENGKVVSTEAVGEGKD
jgi:uncharacterized membrane protein YkoI